MKAVSLVLLQFLLSTILSATDFTNDLQQIDTHLKKGAHKEVLKLAESLIQKAKKENNWNAEGRALILSAQASHSLGEGEKMKDFIERATAIFKSHNDSAGLARTYWVHSFYYLKNNDAEEMYRLLETGRKFAEQSKDVEVQTRILLGLGLANWNLGKFSEAVVRLNQAAKLANESNNPHLLALAYENLAVNYSARADFPQAIENFRKALTIFEKEENPHAVGYVYGNMGVTYERMGDIETAMTLYEKSLEIHKNSGYRFGQGVQMDNIAEAHHRLGHHQQAIEFSLKALELVQSEGSWVRVQFMENLADRYLSQKNPDQAAFYATMVKKELTDKDNPRLLLRNHILMARLELQRSAKESLRWSQHAASLAEKLGDHYQLGISEGLKAEAYSQLNQANESIQSFSKAISLHEKIYSHYSIHNWYAELAELHAKNGNQTAAITNFENSLAAIAAASDLFAMDRFRVDLFRETSRIYHSYASYLAKQTKYEQALGVLEEGRARDLRLRIAQARGTKDMTQNQADLLGQINSLQNQLNKPDLQSSAMTLIYSKLHKSASEYSQLSNKQLSLPRNQISKLKIPSDTLYVEYAFHDNSLLIFSYRNGKTQFRTIENASKIVELTNQYVAMLSDRTSSVDRSKGMELFERLLEPELRNTKDVSLIIVPDGALHHLSFAALIDRENRFLVEGYPIAYAPSIHLVEGLQRTDSDSPNRILSVANTNFAEVKNVKLPRLPLATQEASEVAKFGNDSYVIIDETERKIKNTDFSNYGIIHFATHTLINKESPQRSSIVFRPSNHEDGLFQAGEIYSMKIPAKMLMLSSCRSGSGLAVPGEGLLGLSHAFFAAGARSLVMTYWNVSDENAKEFSMRFYANLRRHSIAEAIQQTQLDMIRSRQWNHPSYWSAFFVAGDSKQKLQVRQSRNWIGLLVGLLIVILVIISIRLRGESKTPVHTS